MRELGPELRDLLIERGRLCLVDRDPVANRLKLAISGLTFLRYGPDDEIVRYLYASGWRIGEVLPLRWEYIDRVAKEVRIPDSKNGEGRVLALDDDTWGIFDRQWDRRQYAKSNGTVALSEYVFHVNGKPRNYFTFHDHWTEAREAAGLQGRVPHDFRRTCARNLIRSGSAEVVAMGVTGHKTASMFRRYSIVTTDDKREALRKKRDYLQKSSSNVEPFPNTDESRTNG